MTELKVKKVPDSIKIERILGDPKVVRTIENFWFYSEVLGQWCCIRSGFVYDEESSPCGRNNPEAGAIHDYFCRKNSFPVVTKEVAMLIYYEFQAYFDEMEGGNFFNRCFDNLWRKVKCFVVEVVPDDVYWHKYTVEATYEEMYGGD